jgi:hypothetical protein
MMMMMMMMTTFTQLKNENVFPNSSREKYEVPRYIMCTKPHVLQRYFSENVLIVKERLSSIEVCVVHTGTES